MSALWNLLPGLVLALASACGGASEFERDVNRSDETQAPESASEPWGERALAWLEALETAAMNGTRHVEPFLATDLVWEDRVAGLFIQGKDRWLDEHQTEDFYSVFLPVGDATYFVSADEVIGQRIVEYDVPVSWLDRMVIGPDGLSRWVRSGSIDAGRYYEPWRADFDTYDDLADRYLALWNGSDDLEAGSVYSSDAVISDSLLDELLAGLSAIEEILASGSWPSAGGIAFVDVPDDGRAVHIAPSDEDWTGLEELGLVIEADDGSGCPGSMAVVLGLEDGRVRREQRYHDIESIRRCEEPATLQPGWWEDIEVPATAIVERTGTVMYRDMEIEVLNGTPAMHAFIEWGLTRFEVAGLGVPRIASVTFLDARADCYNLGGVAAPTDQGAGITLCRTPNDICLDAPCQDWRARDRQLWLHELAHPWLDAHIDDATKAAYLELTGHESWSDPQDPWEERGVEHAADAIAYGLTDEPVELEPELGTDCEERLAGFRILTRTEPTHTCPE